MSTSADYTFNLSGAISIKAVFEQLVKLDVTGGTITGGTLTSQYYSNGASVSVTASAPAIGMEFSGWYLDGLLKSEENVYSFILNKNTTIAAIFTPIGGGNDRYTVTVSGGYIKNADNTTNVTSGVYLSGTQITVMPTVPTGKLFDCWLVDGTNDSYENPLTLTVLGNTNLAAKFTDAPPAKKYSLFVYGGTLAGNYVEDDNGGYLIEENTDIIVNATVSDHRAFLYWDNNGEQVQNAPAEYSLKLTGDTVLTANTELVYGIAVTNGAVTKLNGDSVETAKTRYPADSSLTVTASVPSGKVFVCWLDADTNERLSTATELTFDLNHDRALYAVINNLPSAQDNKSVTIVGGKLYSDAAGNTLKGDGITAEYSAGDTVYYKTLQKSDWTTSTVGNVYNGNTFANKTNNVNGVNSLLLDNSYTANVAIIVCYAKTCTVEVESGTINTGSQTSASFTLGEEVTVTPKVIDGKDFRHWEIDGVPVPADKVGVDLDGNALTNPDSYRFRVYEGVTVVAVYNTVYDVTVTGGTILKTGTTGLTTDSVFAHSQVTVKANTASGKVFKKWQVNGETKSTEQTYTFRVMNHTNVVAVYSDLYDVTVINSSGSIVVDGVNRGTSVQLEAGKTVTFVAAVKEGSDFIYWQRNGVKVVGSTASFTRIISETARWEAVFEQLCHVTVTDGTISVAEDDKGSDTYVNSGTSITVTAAEKPGKVFDGWTVVGSKVSADNAYTFNVTSAIELTATYVDEVTLTLINADRGVANVVLKYGKGRQATATATAPANMAFKLWSSSASENDKIENASNPYTFTITQDTTIYAIFTDEFTLTFGLRCDGVTVGVDVQRGYGYNARPTCSTLDDADAIKLKNVIPSGYRLYSWSVDGEIIKVNGDDEVNFIGTEMEVNVLDDTTVLVNLTRLYTVIASGGTITQGGQNYGYEHEFPAGTTGIQVSANVDANGRNLSTKKLFKCWLNGNNRSEIISTDYSYTIPGNLSADVYLSAEFGLLYSQTVPNGINSKTNISNYPDYYDSGNAASEGFILPGLADGENVIISGMAYYPEKNWMLVGGYVSPTSGVVTGKTNSVLFVMDMLQDDPNGNAGKLIKEVLLTNADGSAFTTPITGIAVTDKSVFIASGNVLNRIELTKLSDVNITTVTGTNSKLEAVSAVSSANDRIQLPVNADFCSFDFTNKILWIGESQSTNADHVSGNYKAWTVGYCLNESLLTVPDGYEANGFKTSAFAGQGQTTYQGALPDVVLWHGENLQGLATVGNKIVTASSAGIGDVSTLSIYANPVTIGGSGDDTVRINGQDVTCWLLNGGTDVAAPPRMQSITPFYDEITGVYYISAATDSACLTNRNDDNSLDPVAIAWQYRIDQ